MANVFGGLNLARTLIIIFAAPGGGKDSLALFLAKYGFEFFSFGNIFRQKHAPNSHMWRLVEPCRKYFSNGLLVPDELTSPIWDLCAPGFFQGDLVGLNGYPRTLRQAEKLQEMMDSGVLGHRQVCTIQLQVSDMEAMRRIEKRPDCREDAAFAQQRILEYHHLTEPAIDLVNKCSGVMSLPSINTEMPGLSPAEAKMAVAEQVRQLLGLPILASAA